MKRAYIPVFFLIATVASGCLETKDDCLPEGCPSRKSCPMVSVPVSFSAPGSTKSVASESIEDFKDAYLFALWASGADAGNPCIVDSVPIAIHTDDKDFHWDLPSEQAIEIMAIVNADESVRERLDRWVSGSEAFQKTNLTSLTFACRSAFDLEAIQSGGNNMPMSGSTTVTLSSGSIGLSIPVKRLFAKFSITLDDSAWADDGWTITAAHVAGARSNTEVPFFHTGGGIGFKQTDPDKLATVDTSTDDDLLKLNFRDATNHSRAVTYYFLENCQDVSESAGRWNTVSVDLGDKVNNCSFLKIMVAATKAGFGNRSFGYRIYLDSADGSMMNTSFNIVRNTSRSITLKLGAPQDGFMWTNTSAVNATPGNTVSIPFETSLGADELVFTPEPEGFEYVSSSIGNNTDNLTGFQYQGTAVFRAKGNAPDGFYAIKGGNSSGDISDIVNVGISLPITLQASVSSSHYAFQRFNITLKSPSTAGWTDEMKDRLETAFSNLSLRSDSEDFHIIEATPVYFSSQSATDDIVNKRFTVMGTRNVDVSMEAYNSVTGQVYSTIEVTIDTPHMYFVRDKVGVLRHNALIGFDTDGGPIYKTPFTGETAKGFIQFHDEDGNPIILLEQDLALGALELTHLDGFSFDVNCAPNVEDAYAFTGALYTWQYIDGLKSNVNYSGPADECTFWEGYFSPNLQLRSESGHIICSSPVHFEVINPFSEWFPDSSSRPWVFNLTLDGSTDYLTTEDFARDWPYMSSLQPEIIDDGNVKTGKNGYLPYSLMWEYYSNEVEKVRIANDLRNYGCIRLGSTVTHSTSGESLTMLWGKLNVWREFIIYAGYQYSQANYISSTSTPYNNGTPSRFIPYLYAPDISLSGVGLAAMVNTTATASTGINSINPSENFYRETCLAEHWWPDHFNMSSYDRTNSTLWDCEYAMTERSCLLQNKVVVYSSPKTVTTKGELSYYELQYAGPIVDSHINMYLGHHGHHADNIYSFRSIAFWNQPAFEFSTERISADRRPAIKTLPSGERYLQLGDYTTVRFFWRKKKASLPQINSYDTRYAISFMQTFQTTYSDPNDPTYRMFYFGEAMSTITSTATAYYDPRRSIREKMKLYTPFIPYYRIKGKNVHAAFDGSVSGSYQQENVYDSHIMGEAYGISDSFWLPGNLIQ